MLLEESLSFPRFSNRPFTSFLPRAPDPTGAGVSLLVLGCLEQSPRCSGHQAPAAIQPPRDFPIHFSKALIIHSLIKCLVRALYTC